MIGNFVRAASGLILALLCCSLGSLMAQEAVLTEFYGTGVHQYFAGNYAQAASDLSAAINGGSKDPRAYYFRALVDMRLGDQAKAAADLQTAAALETADVNQFYPVGKSLERVQGPTRLAIERWRAVARAEAHERQQRRDAIRYEQRRRAEPEVLRKPGFGPPVVPAPPVAKPPVAAPPDAAADDLFSDETDKKPADKPPAEDAIEEMPAEEKPPVAEAPEEMPDDAGAKDKTDNANLFDDTKDEK